MAETRRNVVVGLFVLCGLVALGTLIVLFGHGPRAFVSGDTYEVHIEFESAAGVRSGTTVTARGKSIGHVREVRFTQPGDITGGVTVVVAIENEYKIPVDSTAETVEAGLFAGGRPPIRIEPGESSEVVQPGERLVNVGVTRSGLNEILPEEVVDTFHTTAWQIGKAAEALQPVLEDLHTLLDERSPAEVDMAGGEMGNLSSAAARLDALLAHVNSVVGTDEQQNKLKETVDNIHAISADGRVLAGELREAAGEARQVVTRAGEVVERIDGTVQMFDRRLEDVSRATVEDLNKAGRILDDLAVVSGKLAAGEGSLGKFLHDDRLYEAAVITMRRISEVAEEMRLLILEWQKGRIRIAM